MGAEALREASLRLQAATILAHNHRPIDGSSDAPVERFNVLGIVQGINALLTIGLLCDSVVGTGGRGSESYSRLARQDPAWTIVTLPPRHSTQISGKNLVILHSTPSDIRESDSACQV